MSSSQTVVTRPAHRGPGLPAQLGISLLQLLGILMLVGIVLAVVLKQWA